jgi:hypothetical protein
LEEVAVNRRSFAPLLAVLVAAACADTTSPSGTSRLAPLLEPSLNLVTQLVANEYIVVLNDDADVGEGVRRARARGGEVVAEWVDALRGFAVRGGPALIVALRSDPGVRYVEQVQEYSISTTQPNATWGLDRIDHKILMRYPEFRRFRAIRHTKPANPDDHDGTDSEIPAVFGLRMIRGDAER